MQSYVHVRIFRCVIPRSTETDLFDRARHSAVILKPMLAKRRGRASCLKYTSLWDLLARYLFSTQRPNTIEEHRDTALSWQLQLKGSDSPLHLLSTLPFLPGLSEQQIHQQYSSNSFQKLPSLQARLYIHCTQLGGPYC